MPKFRTTNRFCRARYADFRRISANAKCPSQATRYRPTSRDIGPDLHDVGASPARLRWRTGGERMGAAVAVTHIAAGHEVMNALGLRQEMRPDSRRHSLPKHA